MADRIGLPVAQLGVLALLIWLWQWGSANGVLDPVFVGSPWGVLERLEEWIGDLSLFEHVGSTLAVLAVGFTLATTAGILIGVAIGVSPFVRQLVEPFLAFFNGMPRLVLQPFFILGLGFGFAPKVALVVAVILVMVVVTTSAAMAEVDRDLIANTRVLGADRTNLALHVYLPSLTVALLSSARANLGFALQATLVAEFVGTATGLGFLIVKGQNNFDVNTIWAALLVVMVLSILLDGVVTAIERHATRWMPRPAR